MPDDSHGIVMSSVLMLIRIYLLSMIIMQAFYFIFENFLNFIMVCCIDQLIIMNFWEHIVSFKFDSMLILSITNVVVTTHFIMFMEHLRAFNMISVVPESKDIFSVDWMFIHLFILTVILKQIILECYNMVLVDIHSIFTCGTSVR